MTDPAPGPTDPFARFRVETERMPNGRSIHYYEWPSDDADAAADASPPPDEAEHGGDGRR